MNGKYQPGQKVFLTGGFYTIHCENGEGIKVRESRFCPARKERKTRD